MEPTLFGCLCCGKIFHGRRDPATGTAVCKGLQNHIIQKQDVHGHNHCLLHYQGSSPTADIDISNSVVGSKKRRKTNPPSVPEPPSSPPIDSSIPVDDDVPIDDDASLNDNVSIEDCGYSSLSDDGSQVSTFSLLPQHPLADLFVPKSNSLSKNQQFLLAPTKPDHSHSHTYSIKDLNRKTLPSQKLMANISLNCIYKSAEEIEAMEATAKHLLNEMEDRVDMDAQLDVGDEIILPDDFMADDDSTINDLWNDYYSEDNQSASLGSEDSTNGSDNLHSARAQLPGYVDVPPHSSYLQDRLEHEAANCSDPLGKVPPKVLCHSELLRIQEKHRFSMAAVTDILKWATLSVRLQADIFDETMWSL